MPRKQKPVTEPMTPSRKQIANTIASEIAPLFHIDLRGLKPILATKDGIQRYDYILLTNSFEKENDISLVLRESAKSVEIRVYAAIDPDTNILAWFIASLPDNLKTYLPTHKRNKGKKQRKQQGMFVGEGYLLSIVHSGNWLDNPAKFNEMLSTLKKEANSLSEHLSQNRLFVMPSDELKQTLKGFKTIENSNAETTPRPDSPEVDTNTKIQKLLRSNLQVILTGAPGTGKTFTAKKVAEAIVTEGISSDDGDARKKAMDERFQSVQFHPGYDYSDFVIGMKPVVVSDGGKEVFKDESGFLYTTNNNKKDGTRTHFIGKTNVSYDWRDGIFKKFADKAKTAFDEAVDKDNAPKFVFLIDEINRADLSRVFGELFSLLEEEYRYPNNKKGVTLPNGETFVIPRNLYIIGTMNDIDRSVESMDFALRRRFAWKEVRAKDTQNAILDAKKESGEPKINSADAKKLKVAMDALNKEIGGEEGATLDLRLGTAYQLGGAIIAKFEKCDGSRRFDSLWNNHISNVLGEYLRGRRDRENILKELKGIFDKAVGVGSSEQSSGQRAEENPAPSAHPATPQT